MELVNININKIIVNKNQPRKFFDEAKLQELASSIKMYGLLQPIIVKDVDGGYEIIAGERRYRACLLAGLESVDVVVNNSDRYTSNNISIIENIQREDLSAIEEALAYRTLLDDYELSQVEISEAMGKSPSAISNKLRLLKLNSEVQDAIKVGKITERHGRAMLKLDDEMQVMMLTRTLENNYTVSVLEREVAKKLAPSKSKSKPKAIISRDFKLAINTLKQAVEMIERTGMNVEVDEEIGVDEIVKDLGVANLLVVSKTQSVEDIKTLYDHGVKSFGENRIEELKTKVELLPSDIDWHFIGRIQTKKIRNIVKCASLIHSVDSFKALETIDLEAKKIDKVQDVLIQLNVSNESSKTGFVASDLDDVMEVVRSLKSVNVVGLMTMAPFTDEVDILVPIFKTMKKLYDQYDFSILSMGMSNDYKLAVENGSTLVRIGTKVFST